MTVTSSGALSPNPELVVVSTNCLVCLVVGRGGAANAEEKSIQPEQTEKNSKDWPLAPPLYAY